MSNNDSIEVEGVSVEEAALEGRVQLGARADEVEVEVLATPRAGVLGLGARNARVRVTRKSAARVKDTAQDTQPSDRARDQRGRENPRRSRNDGSAPTGARDDDNESGAARKNAGLEDQRREAITILQQILEQMGEQTDVRQIEVDAESVELEIKGDGSGILIGRHGQTLDALEYIVNRILARRIKDAAPISLETESYRARRRQQLHRMALSMGEKAKREHKLVRLEPMPPRERRVVHLALKGDPMITTRSAGEGVLRSIEIVPADGARPQPRGDGPGRGRRREPERERQQERERVEPERGNEAIGEQGGFKHGQKRIV